jgi:hypothetical protein
MIIDTRVDLDLIGETEDLEADLTTNIEIETIDIIITTIGNMIEMTEGDVLEKNRK